METVKSNLPSISQTVAFLAALSPFIGGAAGWFNDLPWQVQTAWVVMSGLAVCCWLIGRSRYMTAALQPGLPQPPK